MDVPAGHSRRRRNVVGTSINRDVYVQLIRAGWTLEALERYAQHRYAEDIPASTFRHYRRSKHVDTTTDSLLYTLPTNAMLDVLSERARLLHLQKQQPPQRPRERPCTNPVSSSAAAWAAAQAVTRTSSSG